MKAVVRGTGERVDLRKVTFTFTASNAAQRFASIRFSCCGDMQSPANLSLPHPVFFFSSVSSVTTMAIVAFTGLNRVIGDAAAFSLPFPLYTHPQLCLLFPAHRRRGKCAELFDFPRR